MRIAITLAVALCAGTVPVLRADDAVAPQAAAAIAALQARIDHPSALVREHAAWALQRQYGQA